MTPPTNGSIEAATTEDGWIGIPEGLTGPDRDRWVQESLDSLREGWADAWDDAIAARARDMLEASLDGRPDAHMVFEAWPVLRTVRARVQISLVSASSLPEWRAEGFSVVPYEDAPIGPGIMCVRTHEMPTDEAAPLSMIDWAAVFEADGLAVVVMVETTLLNLFVQVLPGLLGLISTLEVAVPGGGAFRAAPSRHAITDDDAIWAGLQLQAEREAWGRADQEPQQHDAAAERPEGER